MANIGQNIDAKVEGDTLTLRINLKAQGVPSRTGKTLVIASTRGNPYLPEANVTIGVNAYRKDR